MGNHMINLSKYPSLQAAVDAVAAHDVIVIPAGEWHCGAARLKSGLTLRFEPGAVLVAPASLEEYLPADAIPRRSLDHYFLGAADAEIYHILLFQERDKVSKISVKIWSFLTIDSQGAGWLLGISTDLSRFSSPVTPKTRPNL